MPVMPGMARTVPRVEEQFATAKTSVWWDIENCEVPKGSNPHLIAQNISSALANAGYHGPVFISAYGDTGGIPSLIQQGLSSTGVHLQHVPSGVKDASDKKILVDMFLWAVDNPAPANIFLISGDRDFSNALHQLSMKRYNILVAHPKGHSSALVSAARTLWLWASLAAGQGPLPDCKAADMPARADGNSNSHGVGVCDTSDRITGSIPKMFVKPPHEFFKGYNPVDSVETNTQGSSGISIPADPLLSKSKKGSRVVNSKNGCSTKAASRANKKKPSLPVKDKSCSSGNNKKKPSPTVKNKTCSSGDNNSPSSRAKPEAKAVGGSKKPSTPVRDKPKPTGGNGSAAPSYKGVSGSSQAVFGTTPGGQVHLPSVIIQALDLLKAEKVMPTEENISGCICCGDVGRSGFPVREALDCAVEEKLVVKRTVGCVDLYVGKNAKLWPYVDERGKPKKCPPSTWDFIEKFLTSSSGKSSFLASNCRYEAAMILKNSCLQDRALGNVLQIMNALIFSKQWITHNPSGWRPVTVTLKETGPENDDSPLSEESK